MLGRFAVSQQQRVEWKPGREGVDANLAKASLPSVTSQGAHTKKKKRGGGMGLTRTLR